jgi:predicted RNA-binding protein YlxR (DUF448 family)
VILTRVGIIDADLIGRKRHRFPNLACMKLSAWYKSQGAQVELKTDYTNLNQFDKVTISKVFEDTPIDENLLHLPNVEYGGTGFFFDEAPPLPDYIEHIMPDYHLYDEWVNSKTNDNNKSQEFCIYTDFSIGFTTRGCFRGCWFCVNKNCKQSVKHSPVCEFFDSTRKKILLLDDNVFACKDWKTIFRELQGTHRPFQYKQGLDERLLTKEKCEVLFNQSKWTGDYIFAFDNYLDKDLIKNKLQIIRDVYKGNTNIKFYVFCAGKNPDRKYSDFWLQDIEEVFERIKILMAYQCIPYVMRFKDYVLSPYRGIYITLARWCNQPSMFKKNSFRQYCRDVKGNGINSAAWRYLTEFEKQHPDISKRYFDLRFEDMALKQ